jgi:drug/metabolite transporter (DMT)-like permease
MPRGVTDQFLRILENERKANLRAALIMAGLFLFAYFMAELTDEPLAGRVVMLALVALLVGVGVGIWYGHRTTEKYNESLRASWNQWMRMSLSCDRVDEVARHVQQKGKALPVAGVGWSLLFLANVLLFIVLWTEWSQAVTFGTGVTVANGIVLGAIAGHAVWDLRWAKQFHKALDELVAEGQVGLWGEI